MKPKDLYLAKSLTELHKLADEDYDNLKLEKNANAKLLIKSLDRVHKAALEKKAQGDDEAAYLLLFRCVRVILNLPKKADYKLHEDYFTKLFPKSKVLEMMEQCEKLKTILKERYNEQYPESSESAALDKLEAGKNMKLKETPINGIISRTKDSGCENSPKVPTQSEKDDQLRDENSITITELKNLMEQKSKRLLIIDCRSNTTYAGSHLDHPNCISVPDEVLWKGFSAQKISDKLKIIHTNDERQYLLWEQRETFDSIILYDWSSTFDTRDLDGPISTLYDALTKWDGCRKYKAKPQILKGGCREIIYKYPTLLNNPSSTDEGPSQTKSQSSGLDTIFYPRMDNNEADELKVKKPTSAGQPKRPVLPSSQTQEPTSLTKNLANLNISNNNTAIPALKPHTVVPDRSTKPSQIPSKASINNSDSLPSQINSSEVVHQPIKDSPNIVNNVEPTDDSLLIPNRNMKPTRRFQSKSTSDDVTPVDQSDNDQYMRANNSSTRTSNKGPSAQMTNGEASNQVQSRISQFNKENHPHESSFAAFDSGPTNSDISEKTRKSTMKRSQSIPNLKKTGEDEEVRSPPRNDITPTYQRSLKPLNNRSSTFENYCASRRRDFQAVNSTQRAVTGLKNLGNTCYMNSIIQCLYSTIQLVEYFSNNSYKNDINCKGKTNGRTTEEFAAVIREINFGHRSICLNDFKAVTAELLPNQKYGEQQDSHEFLVHLVDILHEELNRVKTRFPVKEQTNDGLSDETAAALAWDNFKALNDSIMIDLFWGQQKSCVACLSCGKCSVTFEPFSVLSVPIRNPKRSDIKQCLDLYTSEEEVSDYNCPHCKRRNKATKKIDLWKLPTYLIIQFQRFYNDGFFKKRVTDIDFPLDRLNLAPYIKNKTGPCLYDLYGVSNHIGTMEGGHYTAYCKRDGKWYEFDDAIVKQLGRRQDIVTQNGYIVFYKTVPDEWDLSR